MITREPLRDRSGRSGHARNVPRWLILVFLAACDGPVNEIWVAPDGNDAGPGTQDQPFATLARARNAVRELGPDHPRMTVYLRGGRYVLEDVLVLDERDVNIDFVAAPSEPRFVTAPRETPIVSGGRIVNGWRADGDRMIASTGVDAFRQVWVNGLRQPRARGGLPPLGFRGDVDSIAGSAGYFAGAFPAIGEPNQLDFGYELTWQHKICPVQSIFHAINGGVNIDMQQPCFFLITHHVRPAQQPAYIENAAELIDQPGEWYGAHGPRRYLPRRGLGIYRGRRKLGVRRRRAVLRKQSRAGPRRDLQRPRQLLRSRCRRRGRTASRIPRSARRLTALRDTWRSPCPASRSPCPSTTTSSI